MNLPLFIAKRYLVAKKSRNVINIISTIAVVGVTVGSMALIVVLSVFNGFDRLVKSLFNSYDPDLLITVNEGKVFSPDSLMLHQIRHCPGVALYSEVLEENALLKYGDKQYIGTIKGVDSNFVQVSGIDSMICEGEFTLKHGNMPYAVVGQGVGYYLGIGLKFIEPLMVYVPHRSGSVSMNPEQAFNRKYIYAAGIFRIEQDYDSKYVFVPLDFARDILEYTSEASALEIKLVKGADPEKVKNELTTILGPRFSVKNRFQQQEFFYKIMKSEKWAIFFILTFILIIASFNIVGSLTMLILDKKKDMTVLSGLGINYTSLRRIFLTEGLLISFSGVMIGMILGALVCWGQMRFGWIRLPGNGSFVIDTYPVYMKLSDFALIFVTVMLIGYVAAWYPVRFITRKHLIEFSNL